MTLLLAVMIMSGLVLISTTVAVLAIRDIRNSRAVVLSEPAVGAAQAGAEEGLWNLKRATILPRCTSSQSTASESLGATGFWSARSYCKSFNPSTFTLKANTDFVFYLFDPDNINGDIDLNHTDPNNPNTVTAPFYTSLTVTNQTGAYPVTVTVKRLDGTTVTSSRQVYQGTPEVFTGLQGSNNVDNRMQITLNYTGTNGTQASATVTTNAGMPTIPTIDSVGCAQRGAGSTADGDPNNCDAGEIFSRRINVTVPQ